MPMTDTQLKARRAMYERLSFYEDLCERATSRAECLRWRSRAGDLVRAIELMTPEVILADTWIVAQPATGTDEPFIIEGLIVDDSEEDW